MDLFKTDVLTEPCRYDINTQRDKLLSLCFFISQEIFDDSGETIGHESGVR